jgi:hypothetical protein
MKSELVDQSRFACSFKVGCEGATSEDVQEEIIFKQVMRDWKVEYRKLGRAKRMH